MKLRINFYIISTALFVFLVLPLVVYAQTAKSNCFITKIGNAGDQKPILPPDCQATESIGVIGPNGLVPPPGMVCQPNGYCQLPESTNGSYVFESFTPPSQRWGTKELVSALYTVAQQWKIKYPQGKLNIGDLTALEGHDSHKTGLDVDLDANTKPGEWAADYTWGEGTYNYNATVELGKMFARTGVIKSIIYNDAAARAAILNFGSEKNPSEGMDSYYWYNHENHFHIRVNVPALCAVGPDC